MERLITENYFLDFMRSESADQGWKVITNKGNKRLLHYKSQQQLALSHGWRECLADKGYRGVERFLVTRDGKRWVENEGGLYTLSDFWDKREWPGEKKKRMEGYSQLGKMLGCIHTYFDGIEENDVKDLRKKGVLSRIRFQSLYDFFQKIPADLKRNLTTDTAQMIMGNLNSIAEKVQRAEFFYKNSLELTSFSFPQIPLQSFIHYENRWYLTGLHFPFVIPIHEDTFSLLNQIYCQEKGEVKGVEHFLTGYLSEREISRQEWDSIFAMAIFPWGIVDRLHSILHTGNPKEITPEQIMPIFKKQIEQETVLQFLAHWADLRGRVSY